MADPTNKIAIYEINAWVWLNEVSERIGSQTYLENAPAAEWNRLAEWHVNAVWLMGVWKRSPRGREIAASLDSLQREFRAALPDLRSEDIVGSPYSIQEYVPDPHFGTAQCLAVAREQLNRRGLKLIVDFVPNHLALDHPWVTQHPDFFVQGDRGDLERVPDRFVELNGRIFAYGRDPYFPAWQDTIQVNAFDPHLRAAVRETLLEIAAVCDGVRCDMAMLVLDDVFGRTWAGYVGDALRTQYWTDLIEAVRARYPDFLFIAEAYWDREWDLQQLGFDYCYDKRLYDRLRHDDADSVRAHLSADISYQEKLVRFLENHDEATAAEAFPGSKQRAAAVAVATLPGGKLYHDGQFSGRRVKLPIQLGRRAQERTDTDLEGFYRRLLAIAEPLLASGGEWKLADADGSSDVLAWTWMVGTSLYLVVINYSDSACGATIRFRDSPRAGLDGKLRDLLTGEVFEQSGRDVASSGLPVRLGPWESQVLLLGEV